MAVNLSARRNILQYKHTIYETTTIYETKNFFKWCKILLLGIKEAAMKEEQKRLIKRINDLCKQYGFSYYTLSYKSSVPLSTLMHIMDGTVKNPGVFTILRLCEGLGITPSMFFDSKEFNNLSENEEDTEE